MFYLNERHRHINSHRKWKWKWKKQRELIRANWLWRSITNGVRAQCTFIFEFSSCKHYLDAHFAAEKEQRNLECSSFIRRSVRLFICSFRYFFFSLYFSCLSLFSSYKDERWNQMMTTNFINPTKWGNNPKNMNTSI